MVLHSYINRKINSRLEVHDSRDIFCKRHIAECAGNAQASLQGVQVRCLVHRDIVGLAVAENTKKDGIYWKFNTQKMKTSQSGHAVMTVIKRPDILIRSNVVRFKDLNKSWRADKESPVVEAPDLRVQKKIKKSPGGRTTYSVSNPNVVIGTLAFSPHKVSLLSHFLALQGWATSWSILFEALGTRKSVLIPIR